MKSQIALCLFMSAFYVNAEVAVIVNASNGNSLDKSAISKIYLGKSKSYADGTKVKAVAQTGTSVAKAFTQNVVGKSNSQFKAYWSKLIFTGKGTPPNPLSNDQAVIDFVMNNPEGIGYIDSAKVTDKVKVVGKF
ncbi:phosphate ABC transporter substrate-binding protein [Pseudoalteromonas sp. MMG013]|uniref:Phosphate ABC transporter substrate-binding protein n=1 Tax=Pseudoalteromonas aurantia 208 TaxID=1314867 RepID=A0ABR9EHN6_9GAMM|nr:MULTISPECIES: phosphate ABC transporter substrate-binding protein [Pseudoalteromonas]MBE0370496.1 hypothetical protein [Pseudoalteromonas aurantia 208]MBQ4845110.1 phosphate ABC transporter substrate-binding protein [Pseudoalteromonas sp. MMG005]MBQ4852644.1 phosphate ABC transporter substrate-binding protein [Pseudoalteromonas sp. MMG012]MBQ4863894.1 phosphate ABC transporter substrate-binding protein [Pseudoalteromonas sp. MMG013]